MPESGPKIELLRVLMSEAKRLLEARERCLTIHHTRDIRTAGDEVEVAVRKLLREKVPESNHVGHGHIVDASLATSPQIDVVISDKSAPILFATENGSEYFPYESVHAIGEVKSTYESNSNQVEVFIETIHKVKRELKRKPTPQNYIGNGVSFSAPFSVSERRPYRNPIFSFMLFVNGKSFDLKQIAGLLKATEVSDLPNIICLLDRGVVMNAQIETQQGQNSMKSVNFTPEFNAELGVQDGRWCFMPFGDEATLPASNLGFLWFALVNHLNGSILMRPDMLAYLTKLFPYGTGTFVP